MSLKNRYWTAGTLAVLVLLAADQITKFLARTYLAGTAGISLIPGVFELYYLENNGAAFGIFRNRAVYFIVLAVIVLFIVLYVYGRLPAKKHYHLLRCICIFIAAGAAGNMLDRLLRGYVIDFLYFSLINFPVFNLADCFVSVGAVLAVIALLTVYHADDFSFLRMKKQKEKEEE